MADNLERQPVSKPRPTKNNPHSLQRFTKFIVAGSCVSPMKNEEAGPFESNR